jgi:hypothetical protein
MEEKNFCNCFDHIIESSFELDLERKFSAVTHDLSREGWPNPSRILFASS